MATDESVLAPIFIGGSARSGTHAIGKLLNAHPRYHLIKVESRFASGKGGLCDLLNGTTTMAHFVEKCLGPWWARGLRQRSGLRKIIERDDLEAALARFQEECGRDPWSAGRALVSNVLDPAAQRAGKPAWAELSGRNILVAPTLLRLFPNARFIHMVRDGRAVVAGIIRKRDTTDDLDEAIRHWLSRVRNSHAALVELPADAYLTIQLEDLAAHDRERTYARLIDFLGLPNDPSMRRYFETRITPERAHVGAWRKRIAPADARRVQRRYRALARELRREGMAWKPDGTPRARGFRRG